MASEFQIGGSGQQAPYQGLGGFDLSNLAGGASQYPVGTPSSPSSGGGSNFSQNGPTLPAPDLGTPQTTMYNRMQSVLGNPSQIAQDPAYQFLFNQGIQAFNRTQAGKKMTLSGNSALGAENYGQGLAANYFNQMMPQMLAGSAQELQRYQVPGQLGVARYAASHGGTSIGNQSQTGANPGTQGDMGARDLLQRLAQGGGNYGGVPSGSTPSTRSTPYPQQGGGGGGGGGNYGNPLGPDDISMQGQGGTLDDFMSQLGFGGANGSGGDIMSQLGFGNQDWQGSVGQMPQGSGGGGVGGGQGGGAGGGWDDGSGGFNQLGGGMSPYDFYDLNDYGDG